jgi:hypothetical protein
MKTRVNGTNTWNFVPSAQYLILKLVTLKMNKTDFSSNFFSESGLSKMKTLKLKHRLSLID